MKGMNCNRHVSHPPELIIAQFDVNFVMRSLGTKLKSDKFPQTKER